MGLLKSSIYFTPLSTSSIPVSLFDLESRLFAPTHTRVEADAHRPVKVGRRSALAARSVVSRPRLDRPEHGGHAGCSRDDDQRGALPSGAIIAPQPCIR